IDEDSPAVRGIGSGRPNVQIKTVFADGLRGDQKFRCINAEWNGFRLHGTGAECIAFADAGPGGKGLRRPPTAGADGRCGEGYPAKDVDAAIFAGSAGYEAGLSMDGREGIAGGVCQSDDKGDEK